MQFYERKLIVGVFVVFFTATSCSSTHRTFNPIFRDPSIASQATLKNVPFISGCGNKSSAAALSMALHNTGRRTNLEDLSKKINIWGSDELDQFFIIGTARRMGRVPYPIRTIQQMFKEIDSGNPILINQNTDSLPCHSKMAVVVGYDFDLEQVIFHKGGQKNRVMLFENFQEYWGGWAVLVMEPLNIPTTINKLQFLEAMEGYKRINNWDEIEKAFTAAKKRWPYSAEIFMDLGKAQFHQKKFKRAQVNFEQAIYLKPGLEEEIEKIKNNPKPSP